MPLKIKQFSSFSFPFPAKILVCLLFLTFVSSIQAEESSNPYKLGPDLYDSKESQPRETPTPFHFDQLDWNQMRKAIESGREPGAIQDVVVSTDTGEEPPKPPSGQISFELPYESSLSITGRKVITLELENKHITAERAEEIGGSQDSQSFDLEQELQAKIQGTVARKTTINVNFDDTREDVRDFSVVYTGDPDEVVQEAAFGDIVLSLPSTEFVNYNKQLFGIRAKLQYKRAGMQVIGSRTKGNTETRRFTGATERKQKIINDTGYLRKIYYDLRFSTVNTGVGMDALLAGRTILPISDAVSEIVYLEDESGLLTDATTYIVTSSTNSGVTQSIRMRIMSRGIDYTIDRVEGIITFTNPISETRRVAIDFTLASGERISSLTPSANDVGVIIKDKTPEAPQVSQEIKRFYPIGDRNLVRDNGLGNFVLRVKDKNQESDIGDNLSPPQVYPENIKVNFETGIFEIKNSLPFPEIYGPNVSAGSPLQAVFSLEYQAIKRSFILRPNIVLQSESVEVDGRRLNRDVDYFIDYDIGILQFFNSDLIRESTIIEVTYEFAPFGGQLGETLVGARGTYDILVNQKMWGMKFDKWSAGSTALYNFAAKPNAPPDIRSSPSSLLVTEADTRVEGWKWGKLPITSNFALEVAQSKEDPNLFGRAIIDSMEGIKQEDSSSMLEESWSIAANPVNTGHNAVSNFVGRTNSVSAVRWADVDVITRDTTDNDATQKALQVSFDLNNTQTTTPEQVSLINVISRSGRDFSKKSTLEIEIFGDPNAVGAELVIEYGSFNEDADGDNILDTEDEVPFDGILNLGEDIGWQFNGPGPDLSLTSSGDNTTTQVDGLNTRLDAEDLDGDRALNKADLPATQTPLFTLDETAPKSGETDNLVTTPGLVDLAFSGRRLFQIPLNVSELSQEEKDRLLAVKQVRVTIRKNEQEGGGAPFSRSSGTIIISRLSVIGNSWEPAEVTGLSTMTVQAINSKDNVPAYISLIGNSAYSNLYKDSTPSFETKEQALSLDYLIPRGIVAGSSATTRITFGAPRDFSNYEQLRFFLGARNTCTSNCGTFIFQAGSETEYQQASIDISRIPQTTSPGNWLVVDLFQKDTNGDEIPDTWISQTNGVTTSIVGRVPDLTQISQLRVGIINNTAGTINNDIWVNEIHVLDPNERTGNANRYTFDTTWDGWMDFGGTVRSVDRNFQTPTSAVTNQDNDETNAYLNFNRLSFLPMSFTTRNTETTTPSAFRASENGLVSVFEEGRVETNENSFSSKLILPKLPLFDFSYKNSDQEANLTQRKDLKESWNLTTTYSPPKANFDLFPGDKMSFRPIPTNITITRIQSTNEIDYSDYDGLTRFEVSTAPFVSTDLEQSSQETEVRLAFVPWNGFTFNPRWRLKTDKEVRTFRADEISAIGALADLNGLETPRGEAQTVSTSGNLRIFKWLDPRYSYSFTGEETNGIPTSVNTTSYLTKTITRTGISEVSAGIQMGRVIPNFKPVQSLTFNPSYKLENGDKYEDVPEDFKWRDKLWVGSDLGLSPSSSTASLGRRTELREVHNFRTNASWLPLSGYRIDRKRLKPLSTLSLTGNYISSIDDRETTGTNAHIESLTWPDLIVSISDSEDFLNIEKVIDESRLTLKTNKRVTKTRNVSDDETNSYGTDYLFKFWKIFDISTSFNISDQEKVNLVIKQIESKSDTLAYSVQIGIPWRSWRFTPRYDHNEIDTRDSIKKTNDLVQDTLALQIYADLTKPLGLRVGRREFGLQNRLILNSNITWDKKRSTINPNTNYLDVYTATLSGDYTLSKNFRLAVGGNFALEEHHPDFSKLDQTIFGVNSTLTIQF